MKIYKSRIVRTGWVRVVRAGSVSAVRGATSRSSVSSGAGPVRIDAGVELVALRDC